MALIIDTSSFKCNLIGRIFDKGKQQRTGFLVRNFHVACVLLGALSTLEIIITYQEPIRLGYLCEVCSVFLRISQTCVLYRIPHHIFLT